MKTFQASHPLHETAAILVGEKRWSAVVARQALADDAFVYGVKTTRIYCRPDTAAKLPRRENVVFFDTEAAAQAAGYRPSRHSAAEGATLARQRAALIVQACQAIEKADTPPSLTELAAGVGLSPTHFHRIFKAETGVTPKAYAEAFRAQRLRETLARATPVRGRGAPTPARVEVPPMAITDVVYASGFNSNGRFYEAAPRRLGMPPGDFRRGGSGAAIRFALAQTSLGALLVACSQRGVCAILMGDDPDALLRDLQDRFPIATLIGADESFEHYVAQVVGLVEAPALGLNLPLDIRGTAFQERVWRALQAVAPGTTVTYTDIAATIGAPRSVRAVARACGANPLAIAIPCHRVVRKDGDVSGYRWGIARKLELLKREGVKTS